MGSKHSTLRQNPEKRPDIANSKTNIPKIALEEVYESLEEYKEAVNNVYSLSRLLDDYVDDIQERMNDGDENPINSVLLTTLHDGYTKETAKNYCEVMELGVNIEMVRRARMLFSCKQYESLDGHSIRDIRNSKSSETIDGLTVSNIGNLLEARILDVSRRLPSRGNTHVYATIAQWTHGVKAYFNLLRKDPIVENKWIVISSGVNICDYTKISTDNLQTFPPEYTLFLKGITQEMNSNAYINVIEESTQIYTKQADDAVKMLEEKNALYNFSRQILENDPSDAYAKSKERNAKIDAHNASQIVSVAVTNAKAAQFTLTEAETHVAMKTTTWEYGAPDIHDTLRCVYSGTNPQWNGQYIRDCVLQNANIDIANITLNVMSDIDHYYHDLYHGQVILSTHKMNDIYYAVIVKVIVRGDDIHLQMKEAQMNKIFRTTSQLVSGQNPSNNPSQFIFIDPSRRRIGIGTNEHSVQYEDEYITTARDNGQNVVIQSDTYPNFVASRVAEDLNHIRGGGRENNLYYFDQFSATTMRRQSYLYTFEQMCNYTTESNNEEYEDNLSKTTRRYGADISFEITDRTNQTKEIGNIGMVIDSVDESGQVSGGLSVKTRPVTKTINGREIINPGETIMYVSSDSLLHINGVLLGSKVLRVKQDENEEEHLYWGDTRIV
jgi:hypothetical protein